MLTGTTPSAKKMYDQSLTLRYFNCPRAGTKAGGGGGGHTTDDTDPKGHTAFRPEPVTTGQVQLAATFTGTRSR